MRPFAEQILKWRVIIIIATICITILFGFGMTKLTINSDITSYLKPGDPEMVLFNRVGDEYGGNQIVMVAVKSEDIISYPTLTFLRELSDKYSETEGVSSVTSLINIVDIRDTGYGLEVGKLIDKNNIPEDKSELARLRKYILSKTTYRGKIISEDGTTTLIICKLNPKYNKVDVTKKLFDLTEPLKGDYEVFYSGFAVQQLELNNYIVNDLKTLIPAVLAIILLVLFFSFRTLRGVVCPLLIVVISTIWTMGLLGLTNTPLSILSNVIPVILLALGTAYGIHFISRYYEDVTDESTKLRGIETTIRHIGIPILLTALTTVAGFLSFTGAYITAISQFGIFTAVGVLFAMILSLTFLPAMLSYLKVKPMMLAKGEKEHIFRRIMQSTSGFVLKNRKRIIIVGLIIGVLALAIIPRIQPETAIINFFPKKSEIRKADTMIRKTFGGSTTINIVLRGDLKSPYILKRMLLLEKYLESLQWVQNTQSLADLISRMNDTMNSRDTIPETREEVANLLFLLQGEDILNQMVNADYSEGIIQATFGSLDSKILKNHIGMMESYLEEHIDGTYAVVSKERPGSAINNLIDQRNLDFATQALTYDLGSFGIEGNLDGNIIKEKVKELNRKDTRLLNDSNRDLLRNNLMVFFKEESEIYIDSQKDIENTVNMLVSYAANEKAARESINKLLRVAVPEKYYIDYPDSIPNTGEFVYAKIQNAQNETKITEITSSLMKTFFPAYSSNPDLDKKIRDDLWVLTEDSAIVPVQLMGNIPGDYKKLTVDARLTGMIKIIQRLNESLLKSQLQSIVIAIVVVFLILSAQFKSMRMGAVVLAPIVLVISINFALMGYLNIPLDYATMLVGSILIGVGIDYSIHFSSRYKLEYKTSFNESKSLEKTLKTTGMAIIVNALMVALGFFVLVGGKFIPIKREGWMIGVLMMISAFAALVYLPSLILALKRFIRLNNNK
jgi:predicted RND superfamily exporter protein